MQIFNVPQDNFDCNPNNYKFINDNGYFEFYQSLNCDLNFYVNTYGEPADTVDFIIDKNEHSEVYNLIDRMLKEMESKKDLYGYDSLFEKGYFSWQSDAPANELTVYEPFVYNYLNIIPCNEGYAIQFINNTGKFFFTVEVNTDRSRYGSMRFDVFQFFLDLKDVCEVSTDEDVTEKIRSNYKQKVKSIGR